VVGVGGASQLGHGGSHHLVRVAIVVHPRRDHETVVVLLKVLVVVLVALLLLLLPDHLGLVAPPDVV
jgi:hypothetical protein